MGNWHCVPSSCAEVIYQEYSAPRVRWRYGSENWQEIEGDSYTLDEEIDLTQNTSYQLVYRQASISSGKLQGWSNEFTTSIGTYNGIQSWNMQVIYEGNTFIEGDKKYSPWEFRDNIPPGAGRSANFSINLISQGVLTNRLISGSSFGVWMLRIQPTDVSKRRTTCTFKIYRNGQLKKTEVRSVCPEVIQLPCQLKEDSKLIKIEKIPYLEKIEVVPYAYSAYKVPGVPSPIPQADPIPSNCLNVYNNAIFVIPPPINALKDPDAVPFDSFIDQICSAPGCPPPEYQVLCDSCDCEKCPDGTCPIECGDHICCYNDYGVSVKQIPKSDYCGGTA